MKTLVLNPSSQFTSNVVRDVIYGCWCKGKRIGGGTVLPYWLILMCTILKESGIEVVYQDMRINPIVDPSMYDIVVVNTSSMSFNEDVGIIKSFKAINPSLKSIFFGSHPTYMPKYCLENDAVDFIISGEPDYILRGLINLINDKKPYDSLKGIGFRRGLEKVVNDTYPYIEELDSLPYLDDSFIPDIVYFNPLIRRYPYISLVTSRGCPGKCTFCPAASFYGSRYRWQSPKRVVDEMEYFSKKGYKEVYFRDETFTFNKKRTEEICNEILKRELDMLWICNARVGTIDPGLLKKMKKAGCHWIKFGVESGSQDILDKSKKGISVELTEKSFQWARDAGIDTHAHFMLGMPGETESTLKTTLDFSLKINPTTASFGICTPYPGTSLFDEVSINHPEIKDGTSVDFSSLHVQGFYNEEFTYLKKQDLNKALFSAYRKFYLRPFYWISWLFKIKSLEDIRRISIAGARIFDFILRGD